MRAGLFPYTLAPAMSSEYAIVAHAMEQLPYLDGLNPQQREAVLHTTGPLLVLAGAGSGKTRVITHRIVHLVHQGVAPHNILAVTFTNKAASEMRDRVIGLLQTYPPSDRALLESHPTVSTFHALGVRLLREFHEVMGLRRHFVIYDRADSLKAVKRALEKHDYSPKEFEPRKILSTISRAKGDAESLAAFKSGAESFRQQVTAEVWESYEQFLREDHALDFDDLLVRTLALLSNHPPVLAQLQDRFRYIHVDEYQDTNAVQFKIAKALAGPAQNICVVGDVDQNIYSWRGADIQNVLQFEQHFQNAHTVWLEENYRSSQTIIAASNDIIDKNKNRIAKTVFTKNIEGEPITLYAAMTGVDEAEYIARTIQRLIRDGVEPGEIAILYRTNFQSRALEEACMNADLPYQLLGTKFFDRKEVKDVLSYLRLALNTDSTADLARIANVPTRGLGKVTVLKMIEGKRADITGAALPKVERFEEIMQDIADHARTEPLSKTIAFIIKRTGLETMYKKEGTEEDLARLENMQELVSYAVRFDEEDAETAVTQFLETVALQSDQDELANNEQGGAVRLMTVHAAKGLEFPYVFITGMEEGLFPHERLDDRGIDHEEERRLFYVALTRAETKVYLTYAHMRTVFGSQRENVPSSFLDDISTDHIEMDGPTGHGSGYETTVWLD